MVEGETLRESESRLRFLFDNAVLGIFQTTPDGEVLSVNPAFARMFGYGSPDEVVRTIGSAREFYVDANDRRRVLDAVLNGPGWGKFEVPYRRRDGSSFPSILHIWGARGADGRIVRFEGFVEDISERRRAQDELRESQRRLADILEFLPDATMVIDAEGRITAWNRAMVEMTGVPAEEMIGRGDHAYAVPFYGERRPILLDLVMRPWESFEEEKYSHLQRRGDVLTGQGHITHLGGGGLYFVGNATALRDSSGAIVGAIETVRDVTDRKLLEDDLRRAKEDAEAASRAKSAFLANMSHEIRTPMNAILGFAQILRDSPALAPELRDHVDVISRSGEHLLSLINDILEMSKIEAGQARRNLDTLDLHALIRDVQLMFDLRARSKGLGFEVERAPDLPRFVVTDESKVRQILINLLGNAIKFTDAGDVVLRAARGDDDRVVLSVEDTGPGIDDDERGELFTPFGQTRAGLAARGGTGLGLAISREFARLLGGDLKVESRPAAGSTFTAEVVAPAAPPPEGAVAADERRVVAVRWGGGRPRVLVVDDQDTNRDLLRAMLSPLGFDVDEAGNGQEALAAFDRQRHDLVLMDLVMPVMDGYEAMRRLRAGDPARATPIIAVTASAFEEDRQKVLDAGADDYLRKPIRRDDLLEVLRDRLGLELVFAADASVSAVPDGDDTSVLARLAVPLRERLRSAALGADLAGLNAIAGELEVADPEAAAALRRLTAAYEYEGIARACGEEPEG